MGTKKVTVKKAPMHGLSQTTTTINIGTNLGNVVGKVFLKPFDAITYQDVMDAALEKFSGMGRITIIGWCKIE